MTHFFCIVYDTVNLETACPLCDATVRVLPGASITLDGENFVCDDCARNGDPALWRVLQAWTAAEEAGLGLPTYGDGFDTAYWREALR